MNMHIDAESRLRAVLDERLPNADVNLTDRTERGFWIDVTCDGCIVSIEYRSDLGFGLSLIGGDESGYGEGHDFVEPSPEAIVGRFQEIIAIRKSTKPA